VTLAQSQQSQLGQSQNLAGQGPVNSAASFEDQLRREQQAAEALGANPARKDVDLAHPAGGGQ
jgi:hypothetical protein